MTEKLTEKEEQIVRTFMGEIYTFMKNKFDSLESEAESYNYRSQIISAAMMTFMAHHIFHTSNNPVGIIEDFVDGSKIIFKELSENNKDKDNVH